MSGVWCPVCGDVIGVYEPLVVVAAESMRTTSLAREPALGSAREVLAHRGCAADVGLGEAGRRPVSEAEWGSLELG